MGPRFSPPWRTTGSRASILLSRGANPLYMVKAGGWKGANTLFKIYAKWMPEEAETNPVGNRPATPGPLSL
jgi:hypothetical protein